ncbi:signal transduction histidine kinase [Aequorivita sublithincola DSM 14238]|uniref:histidine kinase n=1 Tax=Aequorivita sublithincola (strain DSM 14238 / LMG 21431 / ACAM 643 / 9-3) TaxID=746697 RepID=I3Z054_AEQSU|nr:HAMP domain-containing sensor histidine kinase [Aequorivita sublithincola]AFL82622.1 signal transduction histidine kinase [Aequorivita sublithincola DSM 14238]
MGKKTKLIKKTSKTFLLTGFVLTVLSSIALYFYTKSLLQDQVEESLYSTEARVINALKKGKPVLSFPPITEIKQASLIRPKILKDTVIYDPSQDEMEAFRELSSWKEINGETYQITVRNLVVESEDILIAIVFSNIAIFVLAFLFLFFFNTRKNIKLWNPFFTNLEQMKGFSLSSNKELQLVDSDVLEFSELKDEILLLTSKVRTDYESLKQFTEDVSHEMQTPLAIIQAKIDNIINEHTINDKQFEQISSIQKDIQRLKNLNQRITLLTKIDNNQFIRVEDVNITKLLEEKIENFKELEIDYITLASKNDLITSMDFYLADILINNLISNAIKHSGEEKKISIIAENKTLVISNYGQNALKHPEKLFLRFYREVNSVQSTGLGLAIVKKICDFYNFDLSYSFANQQHSFSITF